MIHLNNSVLKNKSIMTAKHMLCILIIIKYMACQIMQMAGKTTHVPECVIPHFKQLRIAELIVTMYKCYIHDVTNTSPLSQPPSGM